MGQAVKSSSLKLRSYSCDSERRCCQCTHHTTRQTTQTHSTIRFCPPHNSTLCRASHLQFRDVCDGLPESASTALKGQEPDRLVSALPCTHAQTSPINTHRKHSKENTCSHSSRSCDSDSSPSMWRMAFPAATASARGSYA